MELLVFIHMKQINNVVKKKQIIETINKYEKIIGIGETGLRFLLQ